MKTIYKSCTSLLCVLFFVACQLDYKPNNSILHNDAFNRIEDCETALNGLYAMMKNERAAITQAADVLSDDIITSRWSSNSYPSALRQFKWDASESLFADLWGSKYRIIANANNLLEGLAKFDDGVNLQNPAARIKAHTYLIRAWAHFELLRWYAPAYNATSKVGIPIVLRNNTDAKSRNSMADVMHAVFADMDAALPYFNQSNEINIARNYLSLDAFYALQTRMALHMGDYPKTIKAADQVINSKTGYSVQMSYNELVNLWLNDVGPKDLIFQMSIHINESYARYSIAELMYIGWKTNNKKAKPEFLPSETLLALFSDTDFRKSIYFMDDLEMAPNTTLDGESINLVTKYPGNPKYTNDLINQFKALRFSEVILNKIEALYKDKQMTAASDLLEDFKAARIQGYIKNATTGEELWINIQNERRKELAFEGFRYYDLKRWGLGFHRLGQKYAQPADIITVEGTNYRWTFPIPRRELNGNNIIEQAPGY